MSHEHQRPVTLEDLLRLKRAEQPSPEFWEGFDRQLRAKQLAALVEKRPWWQKLPRVSIGWRRCSLPLGASAVVAIAMISLRQQPLPLSSVSNETPVARAGSASPYMAGVERNSDRRLDVASSPSDLVEPIAVIADVPRGDLSSSPALLNGAEVAAASAEAMGESEAFVPTSTESPSARHIAANFAAMQISEPALVGGLLASANAAEVRVAASRATRLEPLAQMASPSEAQLRRKLSSSPVATVAAFFPAGLTGDSTERQARNLSNEQLYEGRKGRLRATGNSVSMGFGRL